MSEDDLLSNFMKSQNEKNNSSENSDKKENSFIKKNSLKADGTEKTEEEKELEEAKKESKALAAKMSSIAPELARQKLKKMLVFYGIGAFFLLIILYTYHRNPSRFSNLPNKLINAILFKH